MSGHDRDELRSTYWKKLRINVLNRDRWMCHLCGQPIDPSLKSPHPMSASVDHVRGAATGFDERFLRAAHRSCNMKQGDPTRTGDPKPKVLTRW